MAVDAHANFAVSLVATAPSPATSGTSLVVTAGEGARFPTPPFNATIGPANTLPTPVNSEIVRVTAVSTDTLTITRAQESSSARTVVVGDQISATVTKKTLTDIEPSTTTVSPGANQNDYDLSAGKFARLTPTVSVVLTGILAGSAGEEKTLANLSTDKIVVLAHENASSSAANRISVDSVGRGHQVILPGEEVRLVYDGTSSRWRVVAVNQIISTWRDKRCSLNGGNASVGNQGLFLAAEGTNTARSIASGSYLGEIDRSGCVTTTSAGQSNGYRSGTSANHLIVGDAAGRGGFYLKTLFGGSANPANNGSSFIGVRALATAIGNVDASSLVNIVGVGTDPTQSTFRMMTNDGIGTATATDLGANFPWDATSCYDFRLFCPANGSGFAWAIWRTDDLTVLPKVGYESSDIPANSTTLGWHMHVGNRAAAASYAIDFIGLWCFTPN